MTAEQQRPEEKPGPRWTLQHYLDESPRRAAPRLPPAPRRRRRRGPPATLDQRRSVAAAVSDALGWARPSDPLAMLRDCPACGADPLVPCSRPKRGGGRVRCGPHPARLAGLNPAETPRSDLSRPPDATS